MAFPDLSRHCRHALAQMRFGLNSLYHNESHSIANTKTALTHSQSEGGRGDVFLTPFQLSLSYMVVNMPASLAIFSARQDYSFYVVSGFAEWEFPALCRLIATLTDWTIFQANHDMLQCNMTSPHHCETATAVPMHMTEAS